MSDDLRILIVGGYGTFGARLVELLEDQAGLTLLVAGRSLSRAKRYCNRRTGSVATLVPTLFERLSSDHHALQSLQVTLLVDASGPFQSAQDEGYSLIKRCIECRVNYMDLADGSDFVAGVAAFDEAARAAGVYVLSGVSSFPVLTAAVVRELSCDLTHITSIHGGIAPSPYAEVGLNVIRAIASYAGQPSTIKRGGRWVTAFPLTESMRFVIAVPGHIPLTSIRFSLVDVPDARALADIWPECGVIWMGAGPVPAVLHWCLTGFAWLVRLRLLPSLSNMASLMHLVTKHVRWGEHRGGMFIEIHGEDRTGSPITREWHLLAEGRDGPLIPSMAVAVMTQKLLQGHVPPPGARTAISDITLPDYEKLFARRTIFTGTRYRSPHDTRALFNVLLANTWNLLPLPLQRLHSVTAASLHLGQCTVRQGRNPIAHLVCAIIGFPKPGTAVPITVALSLEKAGERWVRTIADRSFSSLLSLADGRSTGLVRERFGPVRIDMALVREAHRLAYVIRRWSLFGIAMPLCLGPTTVASEFVDAQGRFTFDVALSHPLLGLLVHYVGWLLPSDDRAN